MPENEPGLEEVIRNAADTIKKGGIILYPTDTVWGIGCDARNNEAVDRIYSLKERPDHKSMICLVNSLAMLQELIGQIPEKALDILQNAQKPTTIVYPKVKNVAPNLLARDNSLAIRLVKHHFCEALINTTNTPIVSTSANISGKPTPDGYSDISEEILKGVDYIVPLPGESEGGQPSSIIKLEKDHSVTLIRE